MPPKPPRGCEHNEGEVAEEIMDGAGNVIGYHYRCKACGLILSTRML